MHHGKTWVPGHDTNESELVEAWGGLALAFYTDRPSSFCIVPLSGGLSADGAATGLAVVRGSAVSEIDRVNPASAWA